MRRAVVLWWVSLAACVGPAGDFAAYEEKAKESAEAVLSAVETARLSVLTASRNGAFGPYTSVLLTETEEDAGSAQATFESIQPPDGRSDAIREELDALFTRAVSALADLRISARRSEPQQVRGMGRALAPIARALESFVAAHS